ncbi:MAG: GNAT family N-acetyltransferase [Phototrophicaceae bacterium]
MRPIRLTTHRLIIREFVMDDLDAFASLCADPLAMRFMGDGSTLSRDKVEEWIHLCERNYATKGYGMFAITLLNGEFIGFCGLGVVPVELIFAYVPSCWGNGYATEAARAVLAFGFERIGLEAIYATIDQANHASLRVMEKLGFRFLETRYDEEPEPYFAYILEKPTSSPTVH